MKYMFPEEWMQSIHLADGISTEEEVCIRGVTVEFIERFGNFFKLPRPTIAKALYLFHQVSKKVSFKVLDRVLYGSVAIFLSSKLDEQQKFLKDYAKGYDYFNYVMGYDFLSISNIMAALPDYKKINEDGLKSHKIDIKRQREYEEKFCGIEIEILKIIGYDLDIELAFDYIEEFKNLNIFSTKVLQKAEDIISLSYHTSISLYINPKYIAIACFELACEFFNVNPNENGNYWWELLGDVDTTAINDAKYYVSGINGVKFIQID